MAGTRRLTQLVGSVLPRLQLPQDPLVVAVSGGADSAALVFLCLQAGREETRAVHVNHGLPHSDEMEEAARSICAELGVRLDVRTITVPEDGPSLEGRARRARYAALGEATDPDESLLTAHTLEDNAETILFNLMRGAGARGLTGIPSRREPNICRPALALSRSETREIASLAGLRFVDDPMNEDPSLTRNLIRQQAIPFLEQFNSRLVQALARTGASLGRDLSYLESLAGEVPVDYSHGVASCPLGALLASPRPVADRVLMEMMAHVTGRGELTSERMERIWSVVLAGSGSRQEVASGVSAYRRGPLLVICTGAPSAGAGHDTALTEGTHHVGGLELHVVAMDALCRVMPLSKWAAVFPPGTRLEADAAGTVIANGETAWIPGCKRFPVAWYQPGTVGYLSVFAREDL